MKFLRNNLGVVVLLLGLLPMLVACDALSEVDVNDSGDPLAGTSWVFFSFVGPSGVEANALPGTRVTLTFSTDGRIFGNAGCNSYFGDYVVDSTSNTLSISHLGTTEMACEPDLLMDQEMAYLAALETASSYDIRHNQFDLRYNSTQVLHYVNEDIKNLDNPLINTSWNLDHFFRGTVGAKPLQPNTKITINFFPDGTVSGFGGCNTYFGTYEIRGNNLISFSNLGITLKACPRSILEQEANYLDTLDRTKQLEIKGNVLEIHYGTNEWLSYDRLLEE